MREEARQPYARLLSADKLRAAIEATDLKIYAFAELAGVKAGMIYHLLGGNRPTCTPEFAQALAGVAEVPLEDLFEIRTDIRRRRRRHQHETEVSPT